MDLEMASSIICSKWRIGLSLVVGNDVVLEEGEGHRRGR